MDEKVMNGGGREQIIRNEQKKNKNFITYLKRRFSPIFRDEEGAIAPLTISLYPPLGH